MGASNSTYRAEVVVSGRMTPTVAPLPPDEPAVVLLLLPEPPELLAPHAVTAKARPVLTASRARVLLRIRVPFVTANGRD
jgi:hypothetical protein